MSSLADEYRAAINCLKRAVKAGEDMDEFAKFLEKTLTELTRMTPEEIRLSWRIYREAHRPTPPALEARA